MEKLANNLVIVAKRGALRDSLYALMAALPQMDVICETEDIVEALYVISQYSTDLVLMGDDFSADLLWVFLRLIRQKSPRTLCLILTDTMEQKREIEAPRADAVFLKGTTPFELVSGIQKMLADRASAPQSDLRLGDPGSGIGD